MLVPRVVQLRDLVLHQVLPPASASAPARCCVSSPMASPAVDQLVAEYLRTQGFVKAFKAFVAEASYREPKVSVSEDLATICAEYFAKKNEVAGKACADTIGRVLQPKAKTVAKPKPESSSDDSDYSSDESDDEDKGVAPAPAPVSKKVVSVVPAAKGKVESSSSDDSSSEEEDEDVGPVEKGKVAAAASESSSDSDDEEEAVPTASKAKVAVASKMDESSSDDSDEKVVAKTPPLSLSNGKKSSVSAVVRRATPKPASSSSSDSSSDDEEVVVGQSIVEAVEPADDSSEEESDVEMKSVTPAVVDKKTGKPSSSSDSSDSSDDEMEVDTRPSTFVKVGPKSSLPKVEVKKATSSSSDSSSDEDSDDEASDRAKNLVKPAAVKPVVAKAAAPSSSSDSSSSEEEDPKPGGKSVGATSAKKVAVADSDDESDSSDESVEIKSSSKGNGAAGNGKQASSDSSDSSDSLDDDEPEVVTKPAGTKTAATSSKPAEVVKDKKIAVAKGKQVTPEPAVEKSKVKKDIKYSQKTIPKAEAAQVVESEVVVTPVNKKRKAVAEEADAAHVNKKANVDGVAVATANDNSVFKSAQKRKQESAAKTPSAARAFQRVKVEEVQLLDERLADNSYWAKSGADEGWGAKAQEVLGQVRGKGFRHEKTKKKRGSYKGGIIDNASHSIKFENSDDD